MTPEEAERSFDELFGFKRKEPIEKPHRYSERSLNEMYESMEPMEAIRHMHNKPYFRETGNKALKKRVTNVVVIPFKLVRILLFAVVLFIARPVILMFNGNGSPKKPSAKVRNEQAKWDSMYDQQNRDGPLF